MARWKPPVGRYYFYVDTSIRKVFNYSWADDDVDNLLYDMGNCFPTYEEAERALEMVKELFLSLHGGNEKMRRGEIETMTLGGPIYQAWIREYQEREYKKTLPHFVYFASNGNGYLKIGLTSNLKNRLRQLKHANPSTFYIDFIEVENKNKAQYVESVLHSILMKLKSLVNGLMR